jgi:hypothetical protein
MITLTNPPSVTSVLGGNTLVAYNHFFLSPIAVDPVALTITGTVRITSTADPNMQEITGSVNINTSTGILKIEVPQLDFYRRVQLSGPQITAINTVISGMQNDVENGILSVGVIAGVQSQGV